MDANEADIKKWYLERFFMLRETAFQDESSYFHPYTKISKQEAETFALGVWDTINGVNLKENIEKTKYRADLVLQKAQIISFQTFIYANNRMQREGNFDAFGFFFTLEKIRVQ